MRALPFALVMACRGPATPHEALVADALRADVEVLASDAFAGRASLTPGGAAAADWLVARIGETSLGPLPGQVDLRVPFAMHRPKWDLDRFDVRVGDATFAPPEVSPVQFSANGDVDGEVVFAGFGDTSAVDDYAGIDVAGRIVLAFAPARTDPPGTVPGPDPLRAKASAALERGATALILMHDPTVPRPEVRALPDFMFLPAANGYLPLITVLASKEVGAALLAEDERSPSDLYALAESRPVDLAVRAGRASVRATADPASLGLFGKNVFAFLPGTDLADEWIVVGAHYDHVGQRDDVGPDGIYNGADDNASGCAVVLGLARALASRPTPLRRSVVFAWFDGEEVMLIGSGGALLEGDLPVDKIVAMVNLDMVGRNPKRKVQTRVVGFDLAPLEAAASVRGLALKEVPGSEVPSDQASFSAEGVPVIAFHTGTHPEYHTVDDEADLLDYARMESIASMTHDIVVALADGTLSPTPR